MAPPKWIVVTHGIKPGVYSCWIRAAPYVVPVKGRAIYQGFRTEEEAVREYLEQETLGNIKVIRPANRSPSPSELVEEFLSDSDSEESEPRPPPRPPARLTTRQRAQQPSSQLFPQEASSVETPIQTPRNRTRRISVGYPHDENTAYFTRPPCSVMHQSVRLESPSSNTRQTRTDLTSPRTSASSVDSFKTAASSLSDAEVNPSTAFTRRMKPEPIEQLSPLNFNRLGLVNMPGRYPSTPRMTCQASQTSGRSKEPKPLKLTKSQLRNVTTTRGSSSPSHKQSPRNLGNSHSASYPVAGPSSRAPRTPTRPLKKESHARVISISDSSSSSVGSLSLSPSPKLSKARSKLPRSAA